MGNICGNGDETPQERRARTDEAKMSRRLDQQQAKEAAADRQVHKLLLLGAGESGKSTLFKQMITIYGTGFNKTELASFASVVYSNVYESMDMLVLKSDEYGKTALEVADSIAFIKRKSRLEIDEETAKHLAALWKDKGIQQTYEMRSKYQLADSTAYFLNRITEIGKSDYLPSLQDVLRTRVCTKGIVDDEFIIDGNVFRLYDVGGQRNQRKKWIHCFENVCAVLFVASLSAYDQQLAEDSTTNRMVEALELFDEICNTRWFTKTAIILFLNKRDSFEEKCEKSPLGNYFPDYQHIYGDDCSYKSGVRFLVKEFERCGEASKKRIYTHVTCATDTGNIRHVFQAVKDIVLRINIQGSGLTSV